MQYIPEDLRCLFERIPSIQFFLCNPPVAQFLRRVKLFSFIGEHLELARKRYLIVTIGTVYDAEFLLLLLVDITVQP
ncbi:hypothetical protein SDC9_173859 [bioreactor metagenome]|uniref:Uncharacterized protein n=1 Tax=bioreactor metagenome TaxID=1076179 RepID=A0A645GIB6_9ZZZZ